MFFFDPMYFLILAPGLLLAFWAQMKVKSTYARASEVAASSGMSGAEAAAAILEAHGVRNVGIEPSHGFLSDHYDPKAKMLRLSRDVYTGRSVAAVGIAAHEAGHALQDAQGYGPLKLRNGIVPFAMVGSNLSFIMVFAGLILGGASAAAEAGGAISLGGILLWGGILLFSLTVIFQLVNLPVEFDASRRAKDLLVSGHVISAGGEAKAMNKVLNAAALTYVAATVTAVLTLVYLLLRSGVIGGNNR